MLKDKLSNLCWSLRVQLIDEVPQNIKKRVLQRRCGILDSRFSQLLLAIKSG